MLDRNPEMPLHTARHMQSLGKLTDDISSTISPGSRVGYVDYPMHINVGDLLIFLGAMDFFKWNKNSIPTSFCLYDAKSRAFDALEETDVIACHGGGNFGDIYPKHQQLRENIVQAFPNKPVVIMPQSFHFGSDNAMRQSASIFSKHDNVTIYVRDLPSFEIARNYFTDKVILCPDLAHRLYDGFAPIREKISQQENKSLIPFRLMRRDIEAAPVNLQSADEAPAYDWTDIMRFTEKLQIERHRLRTKTSGAINRPNANILFGYHETIRSVVEAIALRIGEHNPWMTSRLHGAILGLLLERKVVLSDNSYGKNSRYFAQWGKDLVTLKKTK